MINIIIMYSLYNMKLLYKYFGFISYSNRNNNYIF